MSLQYENFLRSCLIYLSDDIEKKLMTDNMLIRDIILHAKKNNAFETIKCAGPELVVNNIRRITDFSLKGPNTYNIENEIIFNLLFAYNYCASSESEAEKKLKSDIDSLWTIIPKYVKYKPKPPNPDYTVDEQKLKDKTKLLISNFNISTLEKMLEHAISMTKDFDLVIVCSLIYKNIEEFKLQNKLNSAVAKPTPSMWDTIKINIDKRRLGVHGKDSDNEDNEDKDSDDWSDDDDAATGSGKKGSGAESEGYSDINANIKKCLDINIAIAVIELNKKAKKIISSIKPSKLNINNCSNVYAGIIDTNESEQNIKNDGVFVMPTELRKKSGKGGPPPPPSPDMSPPTFSNLSKSKPVAVINAKPNMTTVIIDPTKPIFVINGKYDKFIGIVKESEVLASNDLKLEFEKLSSINFNAEIERDEANNLARALFNQYTNVVEYYSMLSNKFNAVINKDFADKKNNREKMLPALNYVNVLALYSE